MKTEKEKEAKRVKKALKDPEIKRQIALQLSVPKTEGECRDVFICPLKGCLAVQAHDYIPFGIGRGVWRNMCHCNAVDANWIFRAHKVESLPARADKKKEIQIR